MKDSNNKYKKYNRWAEKYLKLKIIKLLIDKNSETFFYDNKKKRTSVSYLRIYIFRLNLILL